MRLLSELHDAYARPLAYYHRHLPGLDPTSEVFVATTDTFARGFMAVLSDVARRHHLYVAASNDQAPFRRTSDPAAVRALADPDHPRPRAVYVATSPHVGNATFLWGPRDVRRGGPPMLRNVVARNLKVPLTPIEQALALTPGPERRGGGAGPTCGPYRLPGTRARLGFATSLPAFTYGDPPAGTDPCTDTARWYMRCLDRLGANVVVQADANPGSWTGPDGDEIERWQPLSWMTSTWRATADPSVRFAYNVTPMLVGNLGDLVFDGQSAITQRGRRAGAGLPLHRQRDLRPRRGPARPHRRGRAEDRVPRHRPVGRPRRSARGAARRRRAPGARVRRPPRERLPRDRAGRRPAVPGRPHAPGLRRCALGPPPWPSWRSLAAGASAGPAPAAGGPAGPLRAVGPTLRDPQGRVVVLHGLFAVWKQPPYVPAGADDPADPAHPSFTDADADAIRRLGLDGVRLAWFWQGLEPSPGRYSAAYLDALAAAQARLARRGVFTVLDSHQDQYGLRFGDKPGFPDWAALSDGLPVAPPPSDPSFAAWRFPLGYFHPATGRAFGHLYAGASVGGRDLRRAFGQAWQVVARRFAGAPMVVGYDLVNEPFPGTTGDAVGYDPTCAAAAGCPGYDRATLQPFETMLARAIRRVDRRRPVFYEPTIFFNGGVPNGFAAPPADVRPAGLSFHDQCPTRAQYAVTHDPALIARGHEICPPIDARTLDHAQATAARLGGPPLMTEVAATADSDVQGLNCILEAADARGIGFTYGLSWSNPDKELRRLHAESLPGGAAPFKEQVLARVAPRAVAGTPLAYGFDVRTGRFTLRYAPRRHVAGPTLVSVPAAVQYPHGYRVRVRGARRRVPAPAPTCWPSPAGAPRADGHRVRRPAARRPDAAAGLPRPVPRPPWARLAAVPADVILVAGEALYDLVLDPSEGVARTPGAAPSTPPGRWRGWSSPPPSWAASPATASGRPCAAAWPATASRSTRPSRRATRPRSPWPRSTRRAARATASTSAGRPRRGSSRTSRSRRCRRRSRSSTSGRWGWRSSPSRRRWRRSSSVWPARRWSRWTPTCARAPSPTRSPTGRGSAACWPAPTS